MGIALKYHGNIIPLPTKDEIIHLHRRRLTQQLWKDFSPTKQSMEWYKHNTPTLSPFVTDYYYRNQDKPYKDYS